MADTLPALPEPDDVLEMWGQNVNAWREAKLRAYAAQAVADALRAAQPAAPAGWPIKTVSGTAQFLLIAMGDDGCATPTFCKDEAAVSNALLPLMFFVKDGEKLSEDHTEEFRANLESLLEDGYLQFEGDPSIYLYRLHGLPASQAPGDLAAAPQPPSDAGPSEADRLRSQALDLALFINRLVRRMRHARKGEGIEAGDESLAQAAIGYLVRHGLTSPLREAEDAPPPPSAGEEPSA